MNIFKIILCGSAFLGCLYASSAMAADDYEVSSIQTKYGHLASKVDPDSEALYLAKKKVYVLNEDYQDMRLNKVFHTKDSEIILAYASRGQNPVPYFFIQLLPNSSVTLSEQTTEQSNSPKTKQEGDRITLDFGIDHNGVHNVFIYEKGKLQSVITKDKKKCSRRVIQTVQININILMLAA